MGTSATQALEVVFSGIRKFIESSQWFRQFNPHILKGKIRFTDNDILLMSGNSKSTTPLGFNVYCAVLDEAAFYIDNDNKQVAEEIYNSLNKRITSRFNNEGLMVMITSPNYEGDFSMRKLEIARKYPNLIYAKQLPIWKCKPKEQLDTTNSFYFDKNLRLVVDSFDGSKTVCKISDPFDVTKDIWEIPGDYKSHFLVDPEKAMRDYVAIPSLTITAFLPHTQFTKDIFTEEESPVTSTGDYKFDKIPQRVNNYIHIDLALNRNGKGDKAGFAMAHCDGYYENEDTGDRQKIVKVDLAEQIKAGPTGEIEFEDIRKKIYALKRMGFNIVKVTLDQFQSTDTIQILKAKGITAEYL